MKIEIFEPTMCCSTGICGPSVDEKLVKISEDIEILKDEFKGLTIERYQPQTHAMKFMSNMDVGKLVRENGQQILPITVLDGKVIKSGAYPSLEELKSSLRGE
ncbi:arsenite efflux transporter metallochaperone ArsD [Paraclostridium bifermentans]|uniref:arsenite efflux transporter metallochaperone ArsD n=1 Tax=Paraclostridium bifermentans TaxID=1490 RepID=UPI0022E37F51|nr:arsenite efflux transporter metallochaperone ArsD [Paraclostridium bifermentans]